MGLIIYSKNILGNAIFYSKSWGNGEFNPSCSPRCPPEYINLFDRKFVNETFPRTPTNFFDPENAQARVIHDGVV